MPESASFDVKHDPAAKRFSIQSAGELATVAYERSGDTVTFTHTIVPPAIEGNGVATAIARSALAWARDEGLKVVPQCGFFVDFMEKNPEYEDLRAR